MNPHREDVYCPACPDPETAFRIEDVGVKIDHEGDFRTGDSVRVKASRPLWEPLMLAHVACGMDDAHNRLHDELTAVIEASGKTVEEIARDDVRSATDMLRRCMDEPLRPKPPRTGAPGTLGSQLSHFLEVNTHLDDWAIDGMRPVRPVVLPEPTTSTICRRRNLVISESRQWAHDEACGCQR